MTQKEKARAYDGALETARKINSGEGVAAPPDWTVCEVIFPELKESEDEKIRKFIIEQLFKIREIVVYNSNLDRELANAITWLEKQRTSNEAIKYLKENHSPSEMSDFQEAMNIAVAKAYDKGKRDAEKQGENVNFQDKIQVDNQVTRNYNNVLVNLSQMKQIAKPTDKVEPKFHEGDWVVCEVTGSIYQIGQCIENLNNHKYGYDLIGGGYIGSDETEHYHLWTITDAKEGDVLYSKEHNLLWLYKDSEQYHSCINLNYSNNISIGCDIVIPKDVCPATKEQRDALEKAMADAGYTFNFEKKELKKIEDEEYNGEDYGIDSLFHAQRILEKTLGKVEGYQTDDGILSHKCAISAVKKLCGQKPAWSEEDEEMLDNAVYACLNIYGKDSDTVDWLKSLKQRIGG